MRIRICAIILALFFIEVTLFSRLRIFGAKPELLLIATVFFGFQFGSTRGLELGVFSGLLKDIFSITAFGVNAFSFLVVGCLSGFLKDKLFKEGFIMQFVFLNFSSYVLSGIYFLYMHGILKCEIDQDFWKVSFFKGLYTGCLAPAFFLIFEKMFRTENAH